MPKEPVETCITTEFIEFAIVVFDRGPRYQCDRVWPNSDPKFRNVSAPILLRNVGPKPSFTSDVPRHTPTHSATIGLVPIRRKDWCAKTTSPTRQPATIGLAPIRRNRFGALLSTAERALTQSIFTLLFDRFFVWQQLIKAFIKSIHMKLLRRNQKQVFESCFSLTSFFDM